MSVPDHPVPPEPPQPSVEFLAPDTAASLPAPSIDDPPWSFWDVVRIAVIAVVAVGFFSIAAMVFAMQGQLGRNAAADLARNPRVVVPAQFAAYLVVIGYMVALVRLRGKAFWRMIGWNWPSSKWLGYAALGIGLAIIVQSASVLLPIPKSLPIDRYFRDRLGAYLMAIFGMSFAPLVEELFFRGFLYPVIARRWGIISGVTITAAVFAFIHESQLAHAWAPLLLLFGVGIVLTVVRARTGSVGASFLIHVGYNSTLFLMLYFASDHFRHLERIS